MTLSDSVILCEIVQLKNQLLRINESNNFAHYNINCPLLFVYASCTPQYSFCAVICIIDEITLQLLVSI